MNRPGSTDRSPGTADIETPMAAALADDLLGGLRRLARDESPREACGLLFGERRRTLVVADFAVALPNTAADPSRRFAIDPLDFAQALRGGEVRGRDFVGFFHSHVDGDASLSPADRAEAWRRCLQVVVATRDGQVRAHWIDEDGTVHQLACRSEGAA